MMLVAQPVSASVVHEALQLVGVLELAFCVIAALVLLATQSLKSLKLKRGAVTLTQSVAHEQCQSAWKSQQMPPTSSGSSAEEPAKMSGGQRYRENRKLRREPSGDPIKDALIDKIRSLQNTRDKLSPAGQAWVALYEPFEGRDQDLARYPVDVLQQFVRDHCSSEENSSYPSNARKETHYA